MCSISAKVPSNDIGTTTMLHQGTATRLASGPTIDAWAKKTTASGSNPRLATPCAARNWRTWPERIPCRHQASHATPPKLSQNPGRNTDSGSIISTSMSATDSDCATPVCRRIIKAPATKAIISTVRRVGSDAPVASR